MKVVSSPSVSVGVALKSDLLELQIHSDEMSREELAYLLTRYDRKKKYVRLKNGDFLMCARMVWDCLRRSARSPPDRIRTEKRSCECTKIPRDVFGCGIKEQSGTFRGEKPRVQGHGPQYERRLRTVIMRCRIRSRSIMRGYQKSGFSVVKDAARERIRWNPCGRYGIGQDSAGYQPALVGAGEC